LLQLNALFGTNYKKYAEIERKILVPVKKELDSNSNITFNYEKIEDMSCVGKGRKPLKEIRLIPIFKKYIETDIFSNFGNDKIEEQQPQEKEQNININNISDNMQQKWHLTEDLIVELSVEFGIAQTTNKSLILEFEEYLKEQEQIFIKFCKDNNRQYSDMNLSFKRHIEGARQAKIDFFTELR
jgi:hypothetical protein